jgi:hypothetical protein
MSMLLSLHFIPSFTLSTPLPTKPSPPIVTFPNQLHTNHEKLEYLHAWQSLHETKLKLINFTPGGHPICVDMGTTSCISNRKSDFKDFTPLQNTVLKGILSFEWINNQRNRHNLLEHNYRH